MHATMPLVLAGAMALDDYIGILEQAGLRRTSVEDHTIALKKIGYQMAMTYGDWENFLCRLSEDISPPVRGKKHREKVSCDVEWYRDVFARAKLGYALIMMTKRTR